MPILDEGRKIINGIEQPFECLLLFGDASHKSDKGHFHEYIELLYMLEGKINIWLNDKFFSFTDGDLVVINSKEVHRIQTIIEPCSYICIKFLPQLLYSSEQSLFELKYILPFIIENSDHQRVFTSSEIQKMNISNLMIDMYNEWDKKLFGYELSIRAGIINVFLAICRYWNNQKTDAFSINVSDKVFNSIQYATEYISNHYKESDISETEIANKCDLSYSYFSRCFKGIMKLNFKEYINYTKINEAQKLLVTSNTSITDIAMELGFSTTSHFIQQFKKYKKTTPKQFRKKFFSPYQL